MNVSNLYSLGEGLNNVIPKRFLDMVVSLTFIRTLLPFFYIVLGATIKLTSTGPILFRQQRNGLGNEPFTCLKFRIMVVNDEADILQATDNSKRITDIGHFPRRTSLDELLQLINISEGSMSIIGPQPRMLYHTEIYSSCIPRYMRRLSIKPGTTGLTRILDYRGEVPIPTDMARRIGLDLWYIEHQSLNLGLYIFIRTLTNFLGIRLLQIIDRYEKKNNHFYIPMYAVVLWSSCTN